MIDDIEKFVKDNGHNPVHLTDEKDIAIIHDLYMNNNEEFHFRDLSPLGLAYVGIYYRVKRDFSKMKRYYRLSSDLGCTTAMNNLAKHYKDYERDYEKMMKLYLRAIEGENITAMNNLGWYYYEQGEYDKMEHYYLMAIERGNATSMHNYALYHQRVSGDVDAMKRYYKLAIEKGVVPYPMNNLGYHYYTVGNYKKMLKYYILAIENGSTVALSNLKSFIRQKPDSVFSLLLELQNIIDESVAENKRLDEDIERLEDELEELKHRPGGPGMLEAQAHFIALTNGKIDI